MCRTTIQKAAMAAGAQEASWDTRTHLLTLTFDPAATSVARVQDSIAARGYDTRDRKGSGAAYDKLPGCCKYDRSVSPAGNPSGETSEGHESQASTTEVTTPKTSGPSAFAIDQSPAVLAEPVFTSAAEPVFTSADLQANGLTCAMCSNAINKALQALPFIQTVKADIKHSTFHITFRSASDNGTEISADAIRQAVEKAGFSVGKLQLNGDLQGVSVGADKHVKIGSSLYHFVGVGEQVLGPDAKVTVVDKNFLTEKQFRKIASASKMPCVQTGKMESCCKDAGTPEVSAASRVYHVTL